MSWKVFPGLDAYEVGSWTPTLLGSGGNPTYSTNLATGTYVRIGRLVVVLGRLWINTISVAGAGNSMIGGLPYASSVAEASRGGCYFPFARNFSATTTPLTGWIDPGQSRFFCYRKASTDARDALNVNVLATEWLNGSDVAIEGRYLTA